MDFFVFFFFKREEQLYISSVFAIFIFLYVCVCVLDALYALSLSHILVRASGRMRFSAPCPRVYEALRKKKKKKFVSRMKMGNGPWQAAPTWDVCGALFKKIKIKVTLPPRKKKRRTELP